MRSAGIGRNENGVAVRGQIEAALNFSLRTWREPLSRDMSNRCMSALENWVLKVADHDLTWIGLGWLRPAKAQRVGLVYVLLSSVLLGLPGFVVGAGLICLFLERVEPRVWLGLFLLVMVVEVPLHLVFARFWNRRAERLSRYTG